MSAHCTNVARARHRRVALGERAEVLVDHGLIEAGDNLIHRHAGFAHAIGHNREYTPLTYPPA